MFIIQPLVPSVQEHLAELLLLADAARGASAARVTAVMSHYAYARSDKEDEPRISIGGRLVADLLVTAGVNRVLTLTLHSPQVHGFFPVPVDHLHALRELAAHFRGRDLIWCRTGPAFGSNSSAVRPMSSRRRPAASEAQPHPRRPQRTSAAMRLGPRLTRPPGLSPTRLVSDDRHRPCRCPLLLRNLAGQDPIPSELPRVC